MSKYLTHLLNQLALLKIISQEKNLYLDQFSAATLLAYIIKKSM